VRSNKQHFLYFTKSKIINYENFKRTKEQKNKRTKEHFKSFVFLPLLLFICLLILPFGCQNSDLSDYQEPITCSNFEQYEKAGQVFYDQLKYQMAYLDDGLELIPEEYRDEFASEFDAVKIQTAGMSMDEMLGLFVSQGKMSSDHSTNVQDFMVYLEAEYFTGSSPNFINISQGIQSKIDLKKLDNSINCADKNAIITYFSLMKGLMDYLGEVYPYAPSPVNQATVRGCGFFQTIWCFIAQVGIGIGQGAYAGFTAQQGIFLAFPLAILGAGIGAVKGVVVGVIAVFQQENGPCCDEDLVCQAVIGVSLKFSDCSPMAEYKAYGWGDDDVNLSWVNVNGTPASATTTLAAPRVDITQVNTAIPVKTTITSNCSDGTGNPKVFERNLDAIVKDVYGVNLNGPNKIYPTGSYDYYVFGNAANPNYTTQWFISGGTINNSTTSGFAQVTWNAGLTSGWIQAQVTNNCPGGNYEVFTINVTGDGPIP
jgi:hypothetical protein